MTTEKPYVDYKFIGVKSFTQTLDDAGITYVIFESAARGRVFTALPGLLNDDDTVTVGKCTSNDLSVYFVEFGIKITKSYRSYVVFIFNHHPADDEIVTTAGDITGIVERHLEAVDIGDIIVKN